MTNSRANGSLDFGLLVLRIGIGGYMLTHGWAKLQMVIAGDFDKFGDPLGMGTTLSLICAMLAEFGGSILVILGLLTRFAAFSLVFTMGVAVFVAHANDPWVMGAGASKEPAMLYLIPFLAIVFTGAGGLSLDAKLLPKWTGKRAM